MVATLTGEKTSISIVKDVDKTPCPLVNDIIWPILIIEIVVDGYIFFVNLLVKEKRTVFGLLLMLHVGSIIFFYPVSAIVRVLQSAIQLDSLLVCYVHVFCLMQGILLHQSAAVCILAHVTFIMYYSNKLQANIPNTKLLKYYIMYMGGIQILFSIFIILYDVASGNYSNVISNGYCTSFYNIAHYGTLAIAWGSVHVSKVLQIIVFSRFLVYYYKYKSSITEVQAAHKSIHRFFITIGIVMGSTIGISQLFYAINLIDQLFFSSVTLPILLQHFGFVISIIQNGVIAYIITPKEWFVYLCKK